MLKFKRTHAKASCNRSVIPVTQEAKARGSESVEVSSECVEGQSEHLMRPYLKIQIEEREIAKQQNT